MLLLWGLERRNQGIERCRVRRAGQGQSPGVGHVLVVPAQRLGCVDLQVPTTDPVDACGADSGGWWHPGLARRREVYLVAAIGVT